jgi:hypothetical protein
MDKGLVDPRGRSDVRAASGVAVVLIVIAACTLVWLALLMLSMAKK